MKEKKQQKKKTTKKEKKKRTKTWRRYEIKRTECKLTSV